jgi:hypothetical protein
VLLIAHKSFDQPCDPIARKTLPRPPHPAPTSVTIAKRPSVWDGIRNVLDVIWGLRKPKYFCREDWTGRNELIPQENLFSIVIPDYAEPVIGCAFAWLTMTELSGTAMGRPFRLVVASNNVRCPSQSPVAGDDEH